MIQSMKHGGGGVMAWANMAASEKGSLVFIDDVTAHRSRAMHSEATIHISSAQIKPNASKFLFSKPLKLFSRRCKVVEGGRVL